jgi:hypothetical protein
MRAKYVDYAKKGTSNAVLTANRPTPLSALSLPPALPDIVYTRQDSTHLTQAARQALPEHPQKITRKRNVAISRIRSPP